MVLEVMLQKLWRDLTMSVSYKSIDGFIDRIKNVLNLADFTAVIDDSITKQYNDSLLKIDKQLDSPINIIPNARDLTFLQRYVADNLEQAADDVSNSIRQEIQRGILNQETPKQLAQRVRLLFKEKKYQTRLKTIIRTETLRANNQGTLEGAKQAAGAGLKLLKWLDVTMDDRTSNICKHEHKKYGTPEEAIPLDQDFVIKVDNKTIKSKNPPFHPNCRSVLRIKVVGKE